MKKITVKLLKTEEEKSQFYRLRHEIFTEELGWVDSADFETDRFDAGAEYLGVFFEGMLVAATRIIDWTQPWMFDDVFCYLLQAPIAKDAQSIEMTRYFVAAGRRKIHTCDGHKFYFSRVLQHGVFAYCTLKNYTKLYCTFTYGVYWLFRFQGAPAFNLNESIAIQSQATEVPVLIDLKVNDLNARLDRKLMELVDFEFLKN